MEKHLHDGMLNHAARPMRWFSPLITGTRFSGFTRPELPAASATTFELPVRGVEQETAAVLNAQPSLFIDKLQLAGSQISLGNGD